MKRIISGAQTGVDRAALDAALELGFPTGGWCPDGRKAEDGRIPNRYPVKELPNAGYRQRTRQNVAESDGTLVIYYANLSGGTLETVTFCEALQKPCLQINAMDFSAEQAADLAKAFVLDLDIGVLNIAGPRASGVPDAYAFTKEVVVGLIQRIVIRMPPALSE